MLGLIAKLIGTGVVRQVADPLLQAYQAKLNATNDAERLSAERDIAAIEARASVARIEAADRISPRRIGAYLIVIPFGIWFAGIYIVSVVNGLFGWNLVILDVPARIDKIAMLLVPSIIVSEVFGGVAEKLGRRK